MINHVVSEEHHRRYGENRVSSGPKFTRTTKGHEEHESEHHESGHHESHEYHEDHDSDRDSDRENFKKLCKKLCSGYVLDNMDFDLGPCPFNSLPNDKILDWFKFKAFALDKHESKIEFCFGTGRKHYGKKEKMLVSSIFSFSHIFFQKASFPGSL